MTDDGLNNLLEVMSVASFFFILIPGKNLLRGEMERGSSSHYEQSCQLTSKFFIQIPP